MDKGYQGVQQQVQEIIPMKKPHEKIFQLRMKVEKKQMKEMSSLLKIILANSLIFGTLYPLNTDGLR